MVKDFGELPSGKAAEADVEPWGAGYAKSLGTLKTSLPPPSVVARDEVPDHLLEPDLHKTSREPTRFRCWVVT